MSYRHHLARINFFHNHLTTELRPKGECPECDIAIAYEEIDADSDELHRCIYILRELLEKLPAEDQTNAHNLLEDIQRLSGHMTDKAWADPEAKRALNEVDRLLGEWEVDPRTGEPSRLKTIEELKKDRVRLHRLL